MKLKQMGIALIAAGMLSANAYASEVAFEQALAPQVAFTETDLNLLFEQEAGKPMQLAALSEQEMRETEGALLNFAIGSAIGLGTYAISNWGNMTWSGALGSAALGAIGGYGAGVAGLRVLGPYQNAGGFGVAIGRPGIINPSNWYGNANQIIRFDAHRNHSTDFLHVHHRLTPNVGFGSHQPISSLWRR